jgi:hypothetical protein
MIARARRRKAGWCCEYFFIGVEEAFQEVVLGAVVGEEGADE